jgi:hypothetical protein
MAWTDPRTWTPGETVTASLMNAHVRDNMNVLKTPMDNSGRLYTLLKGVAFSAGQGNAAGGGDTQLTSYDTAVEGGLLGQPGDHLIVEGLFTLAANTNAKTVKMQVASGTLASVFSIATNVANHRVPFRVVILRRGQTTAAIWGMFWSYGGPALPAVAALSWAMSGSLSTLDWNAAQTLKIFASGAGASDLVLTDYTVRVARSVLGSTV